MRQLSYTAPDQLRCRLKGLPIKEFTAEAAAMRPRAPGPGPRASGLGPRASGDIVLYATKVPLASLGRRVLDLEDEIAGIDELLDELVTATAPEML
jgi:transposase